MKLDKKALERLLTLNDAQLRGVIESVAAESGLDLREIESIAVNELGMIRLNQSTLKVLHLNDIDTIESFSDSKEESIVPALLSALGIRVGNE